MRVLVLSDLSSYVAVGFAEPTLRNETDNPPAEFIISKIKILITVMVGPRGFEPLIFGFLLGGEPKADALILAAQRAHWG